MASPDISMLPSLQSWPFNANEGHRTDGSILDNASAIFTSSGTAALALALGRIEKIRGSSVLLPAYNCLALIEATQIVGANPVFYRTARDLTIETEHLVSVITPNTRAIVIPHFFGRTQTVASLRDHPQLRSVTFIEDCAHAWFGGTPAVPVGSAGDYSIASCPKFFPVLSGGILASSKQDLSGFALRQPPVLVDLRQAANLLADGARHGSRNVVGKSLATVQRARKTVHESEAVETSPTARGFKYLGTDDLALLATRPTQWIVRHTSASYISARRVSRYQQVAAEVRRCTRARLLWKDIPSVAPYVVPVELLHPSVDYPRLRSMGLRLYRWDEATRGVCEHADFLADALVQLPCHQSLTDLETERLCEALRAVLS